MRDTVVGFINELNTPVAEFTAIPFWFLNDTLKKKKIAKSFADFKAKGIDAIVVHPRIGFPKRIKYLSERFFAWYEYILKEAKKAGLKIIIYDEAMYPSGAAGGIVVKKRPDMRVRCLYLTDKKEGNLIAELKDGKYLVEKFSGAKIRGLHYGEDDGEKNQPFAADILNEETVDLFVKLTHEEYYKRFSEYFGETIIGFFTDEPHPRGRGGDRGPVWTKGLEHIIVERGGKLEELEGLFTGKENETTELYRAILQEREVEVYYKRLHRFCEDHGVFLVGHPAESDDIEKLKYFDIPGQDLIFRFVNRESGDLEGRNSVLGKCSADYARIVGARRNANECLGVCGKSNNYWDLPPEEIKWYIDYLAVRGVNMYIPHAFYYSLRGKRKEERPPDVGLNTLYWKHYAYFSTYFKRISWLMTDIRNFAKVAVLCRNGAMPYEEVRAFYENQIEFNYVPQCFLQEAQTVNTFTLKGNSYPYIYDRDNLSDGKLAHCAKYLAAASDMQERDICFDNPQKNVRVSHFVKKGLECFLLVNVGDDRVFDGAKIKGEGEIVRYDLWDGKFGKLTTKKSNGETLFSLTMEKNESVLLIVDKKCESIPVYAEERNYLDIAPKLVKTDKKKYIKTYTTTVDGALIKENTYLRLRANDVVEWWINGKLAKVTFWNPHVLLAPMHLRQGENVVTVRVIGSVANKYGNLQVPYGLLEENKY